MSGNRPEQTVEAVLARLNRPKKVVVTAGMPYANGPLHLGHLAGAHVPADICARYNKMLIGKDNVLFVCGTDDHGSTSEVAAVKAGKPILDFIQDVHTIQKSTLSNYDISLDNYTGTSTPGTIEVHTKNCQDILRKLHKNNLLEKRSSKQWYDTSADRFLPDRYVSGTCPRCEEAGAYSDECDKCGAKYTPDKLLNPVSSISNTKPELRETEHWWLDMWSSTDLLVEWIESKKRFWRKGVYNEVINQVLPCYSFNKEMEAQYKEVKADLPKHKSRFAPGGRMVSQFKSLVDLEAAREIMKAAGIETDLEDGWAYRSITRDVKWGVSLPEEIDPSMNSKTLYVWPDSLIAPISFSEVSLKVKGQDPKEVTQYWNDSESKVYQFLGQDNVFFYVLMQATLWLGSQDNPKQMPQQGDLQLTDVFGSYHLQINGEKMSKSTGNFFTGDQLLEEMNYDSDQVRYYLALLSLSEKSSNFDLEHFKERNKFLAGPLNAALEKPISACIKKFDSVVPEGKLMEKAQKETYKIVQKYTRQMERAEYSTLLYAIENYARQINSLFTQFKTHNHRTHASR